MSRLSRDWRALAPEQRVAGAAALALFVTMLLPWYQQNTSVVVKGVPQQLSRNLNAFQVFSFIEAAVLLVALAVGYLLYARAEGYNFRVPGSDGTVIFAAGVWAAALLVLRLFDKPGISGPATVGVQWGIFFALAAAGGLAYSGRRMRAAHHHPHHHPHMHLRRHEADADTDSREEPDAATPAQRASSPATAAAGARGAAPVPADPRPASRPRYPPAPSDQMSFEDDPPDS
jgi:hypothetical protein